MSTVIYIIFYKGNLGSITKENYKLIFEQLNKTRFIKVPYLTANQIQVLACDVKKDIIVSDINKSLLGISKHLAMLSDKYNVMRHKDLSLFIKSYSKNCRDTLCIYRKYDELIKHDYKNYLNIIGYEYLDKCKNMIRIERRLSSFKAIRDAFKLSHSGNIYLNEILDSKINPIAEKFNSLKLVEE